MYRQFKFQYFNLAAAFWHYLYERRWQMVLFYILTATANIFMILQPYALGELINTLQRNDQQLLHDVLYWLGFYAVLTAAFWSFHGPSRCIERTLAFRAKNNFYQDYYSKLSLLPMSWHITHHSGNTINRVNKGASGIFGFGEYQFIYIESTIRIVGILGVLAWINLYVALILMGFAAIMIMVLLLYDRVLTRETHLGNEKEHEFSSRLFDYISNFSSVIGFNLSSTMKTRLERSFMAIYPHQKKRIIFNELKWFTATILITLIEFVVLFGYIYYFHHSGKVLMIGTLVAVFQYMKQLNQIFYNFAAFYQQLIQHNINLRAVEQIDNAYNTLAIKDEALPDLHIKGDAASINFADISFHYPGTRAVFENLDLFIPGGQKVGLVGHSGAGKTSLVSLLLRFYEPSSGRILVDGQDIRAVNQRSQRDALAVIPQDISLFEDTLMENIRFGRLGASDEEVMKAAQQANAHEFIAAMPGTYNTYVGERGVRLSGGQRQRIAIARAILRAAPLLVLDEATSSLDSHSEQLIQSALHKLMEGKTVIAIAHRLSTIAHLDRLVVMDQGRIVEDGSHAELLQKNGLYAQLWAMQSGGFLGA